MLDNPFALQRDGERVGKVWCLYYADRAPESTAAGLGPLVFEVLLSVDVIDYDCNECDAK